MPALDEDRTALLLKQCRALCEIGSATRNDIQDVLYGTHGRTGVASATVSQYMTGKRVPTVQHKAKLEKWVAKKLKAIEQPFALKEAFEKALKTA